MPLRLSDAPCGAVSGRESASPAGAPREFGVTPPTVWSLFSGVGGMDRGLDLAGFRHTLLAEINPWRRRVLAAHFPGVPILPDVRLVTRDAADPPDLLCGGFPCQDLSVAGRRRGLAGERSGLFHEFARIADAVRPRWILLENVPGLLSSNGGRDMGVVVGTLADLGYGVGWRVLDARYFGVPQRRRRVFLVGDLGGDGRSSLRCLCESCDGYSPTLDCSWQTAARRAREGARGDRVALALTRRHAGSNTSRDGVDNLVVSTLQAAGGDRGWRLDAEAAAGGHLVVDDTSPTLMAKAQRNEPSEESFVIYDVEPVANTMLGHRGKDGGGISPDETLVPFRKAQKAHDPDDTERWEQTEQTGTLTDHGLGLPGSTAVAFSIVPESGQGADLRAAEVDTSSAIGAVTHGRATDRGVRIAEGVRVRRLTPTECERLMGWPDGWTAPDGVRSPDSKRYAACGDGVVANVAEWIGRRILRESS